MLNLHEYLAIAKSKFKMIERLVNSSRTPEEFILKKMTPPSIKLAQDFVNKYDLRQIIKVQMYSQKNDLYIHNGCFGFMLEIELSNDMDSLLTGILKHGYPENSTLSVLFSSIQTELKCYLVVTSKELKRENSSKLEQQLLASISKQIITSFKEHNLLAKIVKPKNYLRIVNTMLTGQVGESYNLDKYFYEQMHDVDDIQVGVNADIEVGQIARKIFYTKQYPNVYELPSGFYPVQQLIIDLSDIELDYYYNININLTTQKLVEPIYEFSTTLIVHHDNKDEIADEIQSYFRQELNWHIFGNVVFPLQQFIDCIPFQYDYSNVQNQHNYSTVQKFPINKLIQLFPRGVSHENQS